MKVERAGGQVVTLGVTETTPTISITDYSRRVTDDYRVTSVVRRGFSRQLSVRLLVPFDGVDALQRQLADLRATSARWVAGEAQASLAVQGFYKDFSIDLNTPPISYCTLTVEGLAETEDLSDTGADPAVNMASTLKLFQPITVTGAVLNASNVAENDYPEWSSVVNYALGARVIKAATHRIYESSAAANAGNDPTGASGKWTDIGPTNRWAMFDEALGSVTTANGSIVVTINPGISGPSIALLDVIGSTVRVQKSGYDRTQPVGAGAITFLDMSGTGGAITITIAGSGTVSVGTLLAGRMVGLGVTEASPQTGITDYSRKETDDFGEVTVVPRAWAKRMSANALISSTAIDDVVARFVAVRGRPALWIGHDGLDVLTVYGFWKDFSIEIDQIVSKLSLSIEGLSTAGKVEPLMALTNWPDVGDPTGTKPDDNATNSADPNSPFGPGKTISDARADVEEAKARAAAAKQVADDLAETFGTTEAAAASAEAAELARQSAEGYAQVSTDNANAAATYSALAVRGPSLGQNPTFSVWPNSSPNTPASWALQDSSGGLPSRVVGINGNPYALEWTVSANGQGVFSQNIRHAFGKFVVSVTAELRSGTWNGAGAALDWGNMSEDGSTFARYGGDVINFATEADTSGWVWSGTDNNPYVRTFKKTFNTTVDGGITSLRLWFAANWDALGRPREAKKIRFHEVRVDVIGANLGADASATIQYAQQVAADAQGNAIAQSTLNYNTRFGQDFNAVFQDQITTGAGPAGAVASRTTTLEAKGRSSYTSNRLKNSDFANGLDGWQHSPGWVWGGNDAAVGTYASHQAEGGAGVLYQDVDCYPNMLYSISVEGDTAGVQANQRFLVQWLNGTTYLNTNSPEVNLYGHPHDRWNDRIDSPAFASPSNANRARFLVICDPGAPFTISRCQFQQGGATYYRKDNDAVDVSARLTETRSVATDARGRTAVYFSVYADAGAGVGRVTVYADGFGAGVILGGSVFIDGNLTVAGTINTGAMAQGAVTVFSTNYSGGVFPRNFALSHNPRSSESVLEVTISGVTSLPGGSAIRAYGNLYFGSTLVRAELRLGKNNQDSTYSLTVLLPNPGGPLNVVLETFQDGSSQDGPGSIDCTMIIKEFKR